MSGLLATAGIASLGGPVDLALSFDPLTLAADFVLDGDSDLLIEQGLRSALLRSYFTRRLASPDATLPNATVPNADQDRGGWWGDMPLDGGPTTEADLSGSGLWLESRSVLTTQTALRVRQHCIAATAWMTRPGADGSLPLAARVDVTTFYEAADRLAIRTVISRRVQGGGTVDHTYDLYWRNS